ncbi:MAG TPA: KpsF/GutQ family sugar-phosphate isomerase [Geminicoccaceae bacterium]|nr:KpsF/GutQ family sugar-phosphate isomerase [Geminicoccus sp.]HMU49604.1 KpsF/GutQ family sugar-phosphate isomerase [Geminicoccaceae bacterium]
MATAPRLAASPRSDDPGGALASGRRVLAAEAAALAALEGALDADFVRAVDMLAAVAGRIVVSGMGKSGHVARKIAATLASTGAPAMFVHPGEASHGDLGMITAQDAVLALSNSGETAELRDLTLYTRRFDIPLIAMVGRRQSTLAEEADVALVLPEVGEACPMGLAPTTSTTCMLALGDALAVALLERRGFSATDFATFHPGGKLGNQLKRVDQLMRRGDDLPLVGLDTSMADAILEMSRKALGCVGVTDGGRLVGIVTDGDLRRHMGDGLLESRVADVMTANPRTVDRRTLAVEALQIMNARSITVLFVAEAGAPVGALHLHDCLRAGIA